MIITFWGTRSGLPLAASPSSVYGGNTACVSIQPNQGDLLVLDCGTGAAVLGVNPEVRWSKHINYLFSSISWDRVQGVPFFSPVYMRDYSFDLYARHTPGFDLSELLRLQMRYDFFPVTFCDLSSSKVVHDFTRESSLSPGMCIRSGEQDFYLQTLNLHPLHPLCGFRMQIDGKIVVYLVQVGWRNDFVTPEQLAEFLGEVDLLIVNIPIGGDLLPDYGKNLEKFVRVHELATIKQTIISDFNPRLSDAHIEEFLAKVSGLLPLREGGAPLQASRPLMRINL